MIKMIYFEEVLNNLFFEEKTIQIRDFFHIFISFLFYTMIIKNLRMYFVK